MRAPCQAACYGGGGFFAKHAPACDGCMRARCDSAMSDCVTDARCESLAVAAYAEPQAITPAGVMAVAGSTGTAGKEERGLRDCTYECTQECGFDGQNLACVGAYEWPLFVESPATLEVVVDSANATGTARHLLEGALVELCDPLYETCAASASAVTGADGVATLTAELPYPGGFRGYGRVTGEDDGEPLFPEHFFVYPIVRETRGYTTVFTESTAELILSALAGGRVPGRAHVAVMLFDCAVRRAPGITVELPEAVTDGATIYYSGGQSATSDDGNAAILNAVPGCFDIVGKDADGRETHRTRIWAAPDVFTYVVLFPSSDSSDYGFICTPDFSQ